jgi:hypothetical protein
LKWPFLFPKQESKVQIDTTLVNHLAAKLEMPAQQLWAMAYRQVYANIIEMFVWLLLFGLIHYGVHRLISGRDKKKYNKDEFKFFITLGAFVVWFLSLYATATYVSDLVNPEYEAFKLIVAELRG